MRKNKNRDNREWDMEKKDSDWNDSRNQRNHTRVRGNNYSNFRSGSRDENSYRDGPRDDNEHDGSRKGRGRRSRGGGSRGRGGYGGDREGRGRGRRYSDQHKDFPSTSATAVEEYGSGNSWAE